MEINQELIDMTREELVSVYGEEETKLITDEDIVRMLEQASEEVEAEEEKEESADEIIKFLQIEEEQERKEALKKEVDFSKYEGVPAFEKGMLYSNIVLSMTKNMVDKGIGYGDALNIANDYVKNLEALEITKLSNI